MMNPVAVPIALAGLWVLLVSRMGRRFRALGWCFALDPGTDDPAAREALLLLPGLSNRLCRGSVGDGVLDGARRPRRLGRRSSR